VQRDIVDRFSAWGGADNEGSAIMKSITTKLILSALGVALLGAPAFAQKPHRQTTNQEQQTQRSTTNNAQQSEFGSEGGYYPGDY
jgi:hypothetical protein